MTNQMHTLRKLLDSAEGAGYTLPAELLDAYATHQTIAALKAPAPPPVDLNAIAARLVATVAEGNPADLVALGREATEERDALARAGRTDELLRTAAQMSADAAVHLAYDLTERIITDHLRPALAAVHDEAREAAAALEGYGLDPHTLMKAPAKARNAYLLLPSLVERRRTIYTARRWANALGNRTVHHDGQNLFAEFETPQAWHPQWKAGSGAQFPAFPSPEEPTERLLWVVGPEAAKAKPWLPTAAEQDAAWSAVFGEQVERQRRGAAFAQQVGARGPVPA